MIKQRLYLTIEIITAVSLLLILFITLTKYANPTEPIETTKVDDALHTTPCNQGITLSLSDTAKSNAHFIKAHPTAKECYTPFPEDTPIFFYRKDVEALLMRKLCLSENTSCHYGLFSVENQTIALFFADCQTVSQTEKLLTLIRCYSDYFPLAIIGEFTSETSTLLCSIFDFECVSYQNIDILYHRLSLDKPSDLSLVFQTHETKRTLHLARPMVAVTYDDGPSDYTQQVLDAIKKEGAKATFYVLGAQVELYPETILALYQSGCEIGNHTNLHEIFSANTQSIIRKTIEETNQKLRAIIGIKAATVRPPTGSFVDRNQNRVSIGYPIVLWSLDTQDFLPDTTNETLLDTVLSSLCDGAIILMHDTHENTADTASLLFKTIHDRGYQTVTVSELIELGHSH